MTNEQILVEVAKIDGWLDVKEYTFEYDYAGEEGSFIGLRGRDPENLGTLNGLKPYITSHDAILPVIGKQEFWEIVSIGEHSGARCFADFVTLTPLQLCTALLKAKGVWK